MVFSGVAAAGARFAAITCKHAFPSRFQVAT